ncbi:MAG: HNH endonuclease signature motif containing protein [Paraclostridium sp.]
MDNLIKITNIAGKTLSGEYFVDKKGKIFSNKGTLKEIGSLNGDGYITVRLKLVNGKYKTLKRSRVIFESIMGKIPKGAQISHIDNIKTNDDINNLEISTHKYKLVRKHFSSEYEDKIRINALIEFHESEIKRLKEKLGG